MVREKMKELYLTVPPSFFKCPISMDIMKSPVSLSTGVTYDRTSIQNWLDSGHNTCPATMQVLNSTDVIPNLTLRRLISIWSDSSLISSESESESLATFNNSLAIDYIRKLISNEETESLSLSALSRIVDLAKLSEEGRESLANFDGFVPLMVRILKNSDEIEIVELVVTALDLILSSKGVKERLNKSNLDDAFFSPFNCVLQKGKLDARIRTARVLESLVVFGNESQRVIANQKGLLENLYNLTNILTDRTAIDVGLAALIAISTSRQVKKELIRLGIVKTAVRILSESETTIGVIEKVMKVLQIVSTCREGRTAISEDKKCVPAVVQRLIKVSPATTEIGIVTIWSLCYMWRDRSALESAMKNNGLTKVLLVMQSNCSGSIRQMCGDLVKVFRVNSDSCLASYESQTTHITPY